MGRVFTWEEIEGRKFPIPGDARNLMTDIVKAFAESGLKVMVLPCGSVIYGKDNVCSDLDIVLMYSMRNEARVFSLVHRFYEEARRRHVPLELIPIRRELSEAGAHTIGASFYKCLERAYQDASVKLDRIDGLSLINMDGRTLADDFAEYTARKLQKADKNPLSVFDDNVRTVLMLNGLLPAPVHAVRKLHDAKGIEVAGMSKGEVRKRFLNGIATREEAHLLKRVEVINTWYVDCIRSAIREPLTRPQYDAVLQELITAASYARDFLREILKRHPVTPVK